MKKLLPVLIISIILFSGIGISAAPLKNEINNHPQMMEDWNLEIKIKGGFGYTATVTNTGTEAIEGNLTIQIHTEPTLILIGKDLEAIDDINLNPDDSLKYKINPLLGIGPGHINIDVVFITDTDTYVKTEQTNGFVFLFFSFCGAATVNIP